MYEKPTIFISHSTEDLTDARLVRNSFEDLMHDVQLLKLSQHMSEDFLRNLLEKEIYSLDWLVVVNSENSRSSRWVDFEHAYARRIGKPIFSIELERCQHLKGYDRQQCIQRQVQAISREIRVFLSYARKDQDFVSRIEYDLRKEGYEVWDVDTIDLGVDIGSDVLAGIDATLERGAVVLLASENSIKSEYVRIEYEYALNRGGRVIPCIIEPRPRSMPLKLEKFQWIDFTRSYEAAINGLVIALRHNPSDR